MQPVFRHNTLEEYVRIICAYCTEMVDSWGGIIQVAPEMTKLTLNIAGKCSNNYMFSDGRIDSDCFENFGFTWNFIL